MIHIKTEKEVQVMAKGGKILASVLAQVMEKAKPGVTELALDVLAESLIRSQGAFPGFQKVPGYAHTVCVSTNDVVVHGVPTSYALQEGDVLGVDCGVFYKGFHTDMSETILVSGKKSHPKDDQPLAENLKSQTNEKIDVFLETGKRALEEAIKVTKVGNRVGHISKAIQDIVEGKGYSVVRSLVGHGVGRQLHEEPEVPGFLAESIEKTPLLKPGMVIAVEVIYNMGSKDVAYANRDGWTIKTADGSLAGLFERTVAVTAQGPKVLTI